MTKTRNKLKITGLLLTMIMLIMALGVFSSTASTADGDACMPNTKSAMRYVVIYSANCFAVS